METVSWRPFRLRVKCLLVRLIIGVVGVVSVQHHGEQKHVADTRMLVRWECESFYWWNGWVLVADSERAG